MPELRLNCSFQNIPSRKSAHLFDKQIAFRGGRSGTDPGVVLGMKVAPHGETCAPSARRFQAGSTRAVQAFAAKRASRIRAKDLRKSVLIGMHLWRIAPMMNTCER
jgi:hypothetical protein